jgi:hypothetical protein
MPELFLYDPDVIAPVESMRRKGMAEGTVPAAVGEATAGVAGALLTSSVRGTPDIRFPFAIVEDDSTTGRQKSIFSLR